MTGIGVVSPLGSQPAFWRGLCAGESGIAPVAERDDTADAARADGRAVPRLKRGHGTGTRATTSALRCSAAWIAARR